MLIPKIIHQTWKSKRMSKALAYLTATWRQHHPHWQYCFWTDKDNRAFVKDHFPYFLKTYDGFELAIQRADAIRYLILYKLGGVYVDADFECFEPLDDLLDGHGCVFAAEPSAHCVMHQVDYLICNAFMASVPNHPFMKLLIDEMEKPVPAHLNPNKKVLESTGPFMVTRVYEQYQDKQRVTILEPDVVYPLSKNEASRMLTEETADPILQQKVENAMAVHYWFSSWVDLRFRSWR